MKDLRPDLTGTTFTLQTLDGGTNTQTEADAGIEAVSTSSAPTSQLYQFGIQDLDTQYTTGIASGVPITFISVGERTKDGALDGFLDIINFLLGETAPPQVLTTSYGQNENTVSRALAK